MQDLTTEIGIINLRLDGGGHSKNVTHNQNMCLHRMNDIELREQICSSNLLGHTMRTSVQASVATDSCERRYV